MTINSNYYGAGWTHTILKSLTDVRTALNHESMKLSSGKIATSYAELGGNVSRSLGLRQNMISINTYSDIISAANSDIKIMSQALTSFSKLTDNVTSGPLSFAGGTDKSARASAKLNLDSQFATLLSYLNTEMNSGYGFGGDNLESAPVLSPDQILNGISGKAGLKQLFNERFAADSGGDGLGRLALSSSGSTVSISETVSGLPFGLKLSTIASTMSNTTLSQASGSPPSASLQFNGQPNVNETVTFNFVLPDGSRSTIDLKASTTSGKGSFVIGATENETAQNLRTALHQEIIDLVKTDVYAASAVYVTKDFFAASADDPPERVSGTPASAATAISTGTQSDTMIWYRGKSDPQDPRLDRKIQIGEDISIAYGVRANESGFQSVLAGVSAALLATSEFSSDEDIAAEQMLAIRAKTSQVTKDGQLGVQAIAVSIASSQVSANLVGDQNRSVNSLLQSRLAEIEDAKPEESAARIASLTTQLQASYQVASKLLNMSLSSYL